MAVTDIDSAKIGFVVIACGPFAHSFKAEVFIESLVKKGGWRDRIFLITDLPGCFDLPALRKSAGLDCIHLISLPTFSNRFDRPLAIDWKKIFGLKIPVPGIVQPYTRIRALSLKAEIFEHLPADHNDIDVLIYCDCDAIVASDVEMPRLREIAGRWDFGEGLILWVKHWQRAYDDSAQCNELGIYGGMMIAHRVLSMRALAAWKYMMADPKVWISNHADVEKYCRAMKEQGLNGSNRNFMRIIPIDNPEPMVRVLGPRAPSMIGHITLGRFRDDGKPFYQQEVDKLGFSDHEPDFYTLPKLPFWIHAAYFLGWWPYGGSYKIERVWKRISGILFPGSRRP